MRTPLSERIVVDHEILAGKPVIRGTRLAVEFILELLATGQSENEVLANYPGLTRFQFLWQGMSHDKTTVPDDLLQFSQHRFRPERQLPNQPLTR
ncbi:MAG: DUF433 domain-containing protein [Acidobacteria bacterium]|nr:DUF433 domain-containing protein [Acidobacteriota bacterium]